MPGWFRERKKREGRGIGDILSKMESKASDTYLRLTCARLYYFFLKRGQHLYRLVACLGLMDKSANPRLEKMFNHVEFG